MNKQLKHQVRILLLLLAFVFVQLPFGAFHHHEVLDCTAVNQERDGTRHETHLHTKVNDHCFVCSGYLLKDYETSSTIQPGLLPSTQFSYYEMSAVVPVVQLNADNSRAPPVFS